MSPHRRSRTTPLVAAGTLLLAGLLGGCGDAGDLRSAGPTPTAVGPVRLWPDLPPVTTPPNDYGESDTERVPGVEVPGDDVHKVDAVKVVQAEASAHPDSYSGADGLYEETVRQLDACGSAPAKCPVLKPYYRDLTGDGKDDLVVGIKMPGQQTAVRVYMPEKGGLTRIMSTSDQIVSVELAGRDLVTRAVSAGIPGYEYRTAWSWDDQQRVMLPQRDEIIRVKPRASQEPGPAAGAPEPPAAAPDPRDGVLPDAPDDLTAADR
ncbi:hypothetical protein ABT160_32425 [Streptomyces sp. NPDC001941]|uniref:hypothetical protein n=1 Tax=Streptomyces sp. NPDC001941 TaxID=3154659 RepID=UPI00331A67F2